MPPRVLIADDDPMFVELLSSRLEGDGFEVVVAYDNVQALNLAMRLRPDVILLDIKMPGGSGVDTLKRLKKSSLTHGIPVVVASAQTDPSLPQDLCALGAAGYLQKPVSYDLVRECLGRHAHNAAA
ncbi:MAG TPA: response regulator [Thermoanaerobaculia bacterium]|nr:response regulator [Thermoanaerobaculia bacterium]